MLNLIGDLSHDLFEIWYTGTNGIFFLLTYLHSASKLETKSNEHKKRIYIKIKKYMIIY